MFFLTAWFLITSLKQNMCTNQIERNQFLQVGILHFISDDSLLSLVTVQYIHITCHHKFLLLSITRWFVRKRVAVATKQDLTQQIFLHFKLLLISRNWPDGLVVWRMQTICRSLHLWLVRSGHVFTCDYHICLRLRDSLAVDRSITDFKNPYMEVDIVLRAFFSLWNWDIL